MEVNGSFGPIDIAISGLRSQGKQMEVIHSNIANARTTDAGNGEPYRRREVKFTTEGEDIGSVSIDSIAADMSQFSEILNPGHPDADANGYVSMPNVSIPTEMINLTIASRAYQANAAILKRYQKMVETSLELLR